jgi:ribonuclease Y
MAEKTKESSSSTPPVGADDSHIAKEDLKEKYLRALEKASGLSRGDARKKLLKGLDQDLENEKARRVAEAEEQIKAAVEERTKDILVSAMEHAATDYVAEYTVSTVDLPSEDWKGKIIGKEGRNIRALERATGVEFDLEEAPNVVRLSSFDPVRRYIAKLSLETLVKEGRIQPERIEEAVAKTKERVAREVVKEGERIALEAGLGGLPRGIIELLGRFKFRTSYGQNLAKHSLEMVKLGAYLAAEVGADVELTKTACLLHDIGKVSTGAVEEGHVKLGRKILERFSFPEKLINAAVAHHGDEERQSVEGELVFIADAISGARPGARYEDFEAYVKRIEDLENVAKSFSGVKDAYAISAGREVRVIVKPEEVSDEAAARLAHDVSEKIGSEMTTPGGVKVVVIRESRFEESA